MRRGRSPRPGRGGYPPRVHTPPPGCTPETPPRRMPARYAGRCITCGAAFGAGDHIDYSDWSGKCHCPDCATLTERVISGDLAHLLA